MTTDTVERKVAYSPESAAKVLDISLPTLYRWMREGTIRYVQPGGRRRTLIPAYEIDRILGDFKEPAGARN